nr:uncharacterized protein LOC109190430 [Ipomoea batatas]
MPPEPSPWDRKDFFRERKHERSELLGGGGGGGASGFGGGARWREHPLNHHHYSSSRWVPDFRSRYPPGHGKQGGWHLYQEEPAHGFMVSRSSEKILEDDSGRPSGSRGEGKYSRNGRENSRGSFGQRDWRCHSWETTSPNGPGRLNETNDQRLVDGTMNCHSSQPQSEYVNSRDQSHSRDQNNKSGTNGLGSTGQRVERENSLGSIEWKPLKWTRSGSLSSRGSFSHSNSSKSTGQESNETKAEMHPKNLTPIQSPSGDATACVTSSAPLEETNSRKKPRLGWGEGLAKYEKKKVEGPDDSAIKNCTVNSGNNLEANHSNPVILADKSPQVAGSSDCASPATPSSVACSSSPGLEEKQFVKATHADQDTGDIIGSPCAVSLSHPEDIVFNLEDLDLTKISNLNTKINELLQSDARSFNDSGYIRSTALNKLLVWKSDVSKVVEKTELEIDMLENELKSLNSGTENGCPAPSASSSLPKECESKPFEDQGATPNVSNRLISLEISSFGDTNMGTIHDAHGAEDVKVKILDIDSPGSATSKLVEVPSTDKNVSVSEEKNVEALVMTDVTDCRYLEVENALRSSEEENANEITTCEETSQMIAGDHRSLSDGNLNCSGDDLYNLIFAANKESANRAAEVLNSLLPADGCSFDISRASSSLLVVDPAIKEKVIKRKKHQQFKEKILALKFKVFQHLWKEDTNMLSLRKFRAKSQRKFDLSLRPVHIGHQKHRLSSRSRPSSAVGNLNLLPSSELLNFTSRLLSDSKVKVYRSTERMPALILDKKEKMISRFISNNGLVEDPCSSEKERLMINPWTSEEREIFIDKLATFGKDFSKIASFLDHKTTADCIEFYYKNHKSDCFAKTKRKPGYTKQGKSTYLVASGGKRWNREVNAVSLDILGAASAAVAANVDDEIGFQKCTSKYLLGVTSDTKMPRHDELDVSNSLDVCNSDRETVAADVLAGICGSLSSEAMSSCITSSIDPSDGYHEWKYQKVSSSTRRPLTPEVTQSVDDETCSDESCGEMDPTDWTDEEKLMFIQAVSSYGKDFTMISRFVKTRSRDQCKIFFSKARKCLGLDTISPQPGNVVREDANGGGSDAEDACLLETDSSICIKESGIKVGSPNMKLNQELDLAEGMDVKPHLNSSEDNGDNGTGDLDSIDTELMSNHMSPNACDVDRQEIESDRDIKNEANVVVQGAGNVISSSFQSEPVVDKSGDVCLPDKNCSDASAGEGDDVAKNSTEESRDHLAPLPECSLNVKSGLQLAGYDTSTIADTSSGMDDISGCHTKGDSESDSRLKSDVSSLQVSPPMQYPSQDSAVIACAASNGKLTNLDLESVGDLKHLKSSGVSEQHISEHIESPQIIGNYALPESIAKENGDFGCKSSASSVQGLPKADRNTQSARFKTADCVLRKCSSSPHGSSITEQPFPNQRQTQSSSSSEVGKPSRNGDVKLFGQILTKPSSQQNSQWREETTTTTQHPKVNNSKSFGVNDGIPAAAPGKFECNNFRGSENLPVRSYGYWDGNRIQTGFSSLPDSTILLAKYPAAFVNYAMPSTKMEQPPTSFHAVVKSSERNLNGVPVYPREISSSNGVAADFQVYRSREVQPFALDMKQRPEVSFSEMQRRSAGFDVVSGMQQQARGRLGINVVGRGGILVGGGQCTGVSDPVAAIKMHYAKVEQFGGQGGSMMREEDTWRGKGEIGSNSSSYDMIGQWRTASKGRLFD